MSDAQKTLTVSIATFNGQKTLERALSSCVIQNAELLDVLVVDDGSSDGSAAIARRYAQKYPGVFRLISKENGGYGSAQNVAIQNACGRYFKTLDCDDFFSSDILNSFVQSLKDIDADIVLTDYQTVKANGDTEVCHAIGDYAPGQVYPLNKASHFSANIQALCVRTQLLRDANLRLREHCLYTDMEMVYFAAKASSSFQTLPGVLYGYCIGVDEQSVSLKSYQKHTKDYESVLCDVLQDAEALCGQPGDDKTASLIEYAQSITLFQVLNYLRFSPSRESKTKLREFDQAMLKKFPLVCSRIHRKNLSILRKTNYSTYFVFSWIERHR